MESQDEFEVKFKNGGSGSINLVIKRKNYPKPTRYETDSSLPAQNREIFLQKLKEEEMRFQKGSIASFYDRPSVSYKTLMQMAFAELNDYERQKGLQTHEIAQWLCKKFPYFSTIKTLMQCINARLISSDCFVKYKVGKKVWWKCYDDCSPNARDVISAQKHFEREMMASRTALRQSRTRKRPNFFSVDWHGKDKRKQKLQTSENDLPLKTPKLEVKEEEREIESDWISQIDFLKNSEAIVQPCSPMKPQSMKKVPSEKKKPKNIFEIFFSYLRLEPVGTDQPPTTENTDSANEVSPTSAEIRHSSHSCRPLFADKDTQEKQSFSTKNVLTLKHIESNKCFEVSGAAPSVKNTISGKRKTNSKESPRLLTRTKIFKLLSPPFLSPSIHPWPASIQNTSTQLTLTTKRSPFTEIKTDTNSPNCRKNTGTHAITLEKKPRKVYIKPKPIAPNLPGYPQSSPTTRIPRVLHNNLDQNKPTCAIVAGSNGSPMFPTIQKIFSMRDHVTPQKLSPRFPGKENCLRTPTMIRSSWGKVFISPSNVVPVFSNIPVLNQQVYPAFLTVPQVYGCFVDPPPSLCDTLQSDLASLESFAQPTWTRDVKQSVMTSVMPDHACFNILPQ